MQAPYPIDPNAIYDDGALYLSLGLSPACLTRARRGGLLRFTRQGHRTLYLGRWILDWLEAAARPREVAQ